MSLILLIIGGILLVLAVILYLGNGKRPNGYPPGPFPVPILGNLHQVGLEPYKSFVKLGKKYGSIFSIDLGPFRSVVINDLKLLKHCLNDPAFSGRPKIRSFLERNGQHAQYTRGIITSEGHLWTEQRRFTLRNLRDFGFGKSSMEEIIQEEVQEVVEAMLKTAGNPIDTRYLFNIAVVNSVWRICSGDRMSHEDPKLQKLIVDINNAVSAASPIVFFFPIITRLFPKLSGFQAMINGFIEMCSFVTEAYDFHKATIIFGKPRDLIDAMIDEIEATTVSNSSFYKDEGKANVIKSLEDLFLAGAETTSTTLSWIFLFMAMYPEIQEKLHNEIDTVVGLARRPELLDRENMPYTECVMMETLRIVSLVPLALMHRTTEDVHLQGYTIPKDTVVIPNLYGVMHNDDIWGDPENFRPERFLLPDGTANKSHEAFIPFSYGKRICIGEKLSRDEIFLFTSSLFQKFNVTLNSKRPKPSLKPRLGMILSPKPHELVLFKRI